MCTPKCMFVCVLIFSCKMDINCLLVGLVKTCIACILGCITKITKGVKSDCQLTVFYCIWNKSVLPQKCPTSTTSRLPWLNFSFLNIMVKYNFMFYFHILWHIYSKWLFQVSDSHLALSFFYYFPKPLLLYIKYNHPHSWFDILGMNFFQITCFIFTVVIMAYIMLIRKVWLLRKPESELSDSLWSYHRFLLDPAESDWLQARKIIIGLFPSIWHAAFPHVDWRTLLQTSCIFRPAAAQLP